MVLIGCISSVGLAIGCQGSFKKIATPYGIVPRERTIILLSFKTQMQMPHFVAISEFAQNGEYCKACERTKGSPLQQFC